MDIKNTKLMTDELAITEELIKSHGLTPDEYERIFDLIGRKPTLTELGIFSAMWNEHCSYKSSKKWLRTLPTTGEHVIHGPGENAGVVDIGDGECVIFKMESHNHPSYIEPYQGAATGVGGILRDVFTMGARPVAAMNALRFGDVNHEKTRHLVSGVVSGVGGYGNSFGVPTIGGEVEFDARYNGNCLVNAFAAGIAKTDNIFLCKAQGVGLPVVYLGAKTGRDGVGGATMASAEFDETIDEKRPTVQVGDPFTEKCLLEACLELMQTGAVIAIQDMGAAGLTCSAVEMGASGDLGIELDLDLVPVRETHMSAYEIMLSESQERMLMVLDPQKEDSAKEIFTRWGLDFAIIGKTTDDLRFKVFYQGKERANLPIKDLGDEAPEYDRPWREPGLYSPLFSDQVSEPEDYGLTLMALLGSPNQSSRRWVWEQYDTLIQGNSLQTPGGDAGVVRVNDHDKKALAFSCDVTPHYCEADAYEGGKQAVAECWRNITATGAIPLAATDNLNFGNPERAEIMGQFVKAVEGIGDACRALDFPIVSGNVSLYNESFGNAILPTPTIAGVGLLDDWARLVNIGGGNQGDAIIMFGGDGTHLGQSAYMRDIIGKIAGPPPPVDLGVERRNGDFIRSAIHNGQLTSCHDISQGGLALALGEMCMAGNYGMDIDLDNVDTPLHGFLFGEDQGRYVVTVEHKLAQFIANNAADQGIQFRILGHISGDRLNIKDVLSLDIADMKSTHESWFPRYMS